MIRSSFWLLIGTLGLGISTGSSALATENLLKKEPAVSSNENLSNIDRAKNFFDRLRVDQLSLVDDFYDAQADFRDPLHELKGAAAIKAYYASLYKSVESIRFDYSRAYATGAVVTLEWTMRLRAPALASEEVIVDGVSVIEFGGTQGKVIRHRDYFDMGEFVYERLPVLKHLIKAIKKRFANQGS